MTKREAERLAKLEQQVKDGFRDIRDDIKEIKDLVKSQNEIFVNKDEATQFVKKDEASKDFVTRLEVYAVSGVLTMIIALAAFWFSHFGKAQ